MVTKTEQQLRFEEAFREGSAHAFAMADFSINEEGEYVNSAVAIMYRLIAEYHTIIGKEQV